MNSQIYLKCWKMFYFSVILVIYTNIRMPQSRLSSIITDLIEMIITGEDAFMGKLNLVTLKFKV